MFLQINSDGVPSNYDEKELKKIFSNYSNWDDNFLSVSVKSQTNLRRTVSDTILSSNENKIKKQRRSSSDSQLLKSNSDLLMTKLNIEDIIKYHNFHKIKQNLSLLKKEFIDLDKNKELISNIIQQLQIRHEHLSQKNKVQETQIELLKCENKILLDKLNQNTENLHLIDMKQNLEICENKLNKLDKTMLNLLNSYQLSKANELRYERENRKLLQKNEELKQLLRDTISDLDKFQNGADTVKKLHNEMTATCEFWLRQITEKNREADVLNSFVNTCFQFNKIEEIRKNYEEILVRQDRIEEKLAKFEETKTIFLCPESVNVTQTLYTVGNRKKFDDLIQILYDEIGKTWNQNKEIQDHYKDFYIQETQSQSNQFEGQSDVDGPYCTIFDDDFELECVCEPCEEID